MLCFVYIHDYTYYLVHVRNDICRLYNVLICDIIYSNIVNRNDDVLLTTSLVWLSSMHTQTQHIYVYVHCDKGNRSQAMIGDMNTYGGSICRKVKLTVAL